MEVERIQLEDDAIRIVTLNEMKSMAAIQETLFTPPLTPPSSQQDKSKQTKPRPKPKPRLPKRVASSDTVFDLSNFNGDDYSIAKLQISMKEKAFAQDLRLLNHVFAQSRRLIVITGAGISVAAGIPDFRSKTGLFRELKSDLKLKTSGKAMFDAAVYQDTNSLENFHSTIRSLYYVCANAKPTSFHHLLNDVATDGRLERLYTQNIDCLDTSFPALQTNVPLINKPWPKTIQLHGSVSTMVCSKCKATSNLRPEMFIGGEAPNCVECIELESVREVVGKRCQGIGKIRPRIVLYNEDNPDALAIGSVSLADISARPDGLVVVGTTLKIPGVRRLVREMSQAVHSANGAVVWLNVDSPPSLKEFDGCFDMIVKGDCQVIPQLLKDYNIEVKAKLEQEAQAKLLRKEKAELKAKEKLKQKTLEDHFKVTKKTVTTNKKIVTNT